MKKLKTILVEDEGAALRRMKKMADENIYLDIVSTATSGQEAILKIKEFMPNLLLLDIQLKDMTAFEMLNSLKNSFDGQIIFSTAYHKYAIEAFNIAAVDYLLKPFNQKRFDLAISKAYDRSERTNMGKLIELFQLEKNEKFNRIQINEGNNIHYFNHNHIIWIEAEGYYCKIHLDNNKSTLIRKTMKEMESLIPEKTFKRVNRSSIININQILKETKYIAQHHIFMKGGIKIKVSEKFSF